MKSIIPAIKIDYKPIEDVVREANEVYERDYKKENDTAENKLQFVLGYVKTEYIRLCIKVETRHNESIKDSVSVAHIDKFH